MQTNQTLMPLKYRWTGRGTWVYQGLTHTPGRDPNKKGKASRRKHKATRPGVFHSPDNPCTITGQSQEHELASQRSRFRFADSKCGRIWPLDALYCPPFERHSKIIIQKSVGESKRSLLLRRYETRLLSGTWTRLSGTTMGRFCCRNRLVLFLQLTSSC